MWLASKDLLSIEFVNETWSLSETEKRYINGIHKRSAGLAETPSEGGDLDKLHNAYEVLVIVVCLLDTQQSTCNIQG